MTGLAKIHGDELPLGPDDIIDFIQQYGYVFIGKDVGQGFYGWLTIKPITYENQHSSKNRIFFQLDLDRHTNWEFDVWSPRLSTKWDKMWGNDLTGAVTGFLEMVNQLEKESVWS